ncbi:MAG: hypothetical protein SYR96_38010 [Actinomycetota bacterium]|nr:hypothetical protein [Actinomycetota bacterium]
MPSLSQRVRAFVAGPQGRRMIDEGRRQLAKPENQRKLRSLLARFQSRR